MILFDSSRADNDKLFDDPAHKIRMSEIDIDGILDDLEYRPSILGKKKPKRVIVLIHGFNSDRKRVAEVYKKIAESMYLAMSRMNGFKPEVQDTEIVGFRWPSDGRVLHYYADIKDAHRASAALYNLVTVLHLKYGVEDVHLVAHSMGGEVVCHLLQNLTPYDVKSITLQGADVPRADLEVNGKYGKYSDRTMLRNYYSTGDEIVGLVAKFARFGTRAGALGLPDNKPSKWDNFDAQKIHGKEVDHNTYMDSYPLIFGVVNEIMKQDSANRQGRI